MQAELAADLSAHMRARAGLVGLPPYRDVRVSPLGAIPDFVGTFPRGQEGARRVRPATRKHFGGRCTEAAVW